MADADKTGPSPFLQRVVNTLWQVTYETQQLQAAHQDLRDEVLHLRGEDYQSGSLREPSAPVSSSPFLTQSTPSLSVLACTLHHTDTHRFLSRYLTPSEPTLEQVSQRSEPQLPKAKRKTRSTKAIHRNEDTQQNNLRNQERFQQQQLQRFVPRSMPLPLPPVYFSDSPLPSASEGWLPCVIDDTGKPFVVTRPVRLPNFPGWGSRPIAANRAAFLTCGYKLVGFLLLSFMPRQHLPHNRRI